MSKEYKEAYDGERNTNDQHMERHLISFIKLKEQENKTIFHLSVCQLWIFLNLLKCWDIFILKHLLMELTFV